MRTRAPRSAEGSKEAGRNRKSPRAPVRDGKKTTHPEKLKRLRMALFNAMADASLASAREALLLDGVELLSPSAYQELWLFEDIAKQGLGDFELPAPKTSPLSRQ